MKSNHSQMRWFPNYFRKGALFIIVLSIGMTFLLKNYLQVDVGANEILGNGLLIAMLIFMYSEGKEEDEMIQNIRLRSLAASVSGVIIYAIITPYTNWLLGDGFYLETSGYGILWLLFVSYVSMRILFYYLEKNNEKHN